MAAPSRCHSRSRSRSRSRSSSRSSSRSRRDTKVEEEEEEEGDYVVHIISAFSDKILCTLQPPRSSTVLDVKRHVQTTPQGINIFRQRLIISPAGPQVEDHDVLATLAGLWLQLVKLEYTDDSEDEVGKSLHAAGEGAVHEVERLLRLPFRPDCRQAGDEVTALMIATQEGHLEVARLLCEAGADKDKADQHGATALMQASLLAHVEVARLLCEAGADKDKADQDGATVLMLASGFGRLEVVRLLCQEGADKDKATQYGFTALMLASVNGHLEVARLLSEARADKDKAKQDGATALMTGLTTVTWRLCGCSARQGLTRRRRTRLAPRP